MLETTTTRRSLMLVGAGHAHVQILRRWAMQPVPRVDLTLVVDVALAVYSGMVPGFVAGQYRHEELAIDAVPLARRAGARVILARALRIEAGERRLHVEGRPAIRYDVASLDIGSTVAGLELPGVAQHALATRPIGRFVAELEAFLARALAARKAGRQPGATRSAPLRVVVVGGGAGGVELAFTLRERLARGAGASAVELSLVHAGERLLAGYPRSLVARVERLAAARGIRILSRCRAIAAEADGLQLDDGSRLPCDALVWVAGAAAHGLLGTSQLPTDARGFVLTRPTLQVVGHDELFAAGDCASLVEHPHTPKAGVYAVRQGPLLDANLRAALAGQPLGGYRPQRDFLTLLNLGDGRAFGSKWGVSFEGRWVMRLKDRIDRRFMRLFQVLDADAALSDAFTAMPPMASSSMLCGGCAAKIGQPVLERALARLGPPLADASVVLGLAAADDATAVATPRGDVVVASLDAFKAFTDDPYLVGSVAAVNALSDLFAKGVTPRHAQALVALPDGLDPEASEELLFQVLAGARSVLDALRVTLLGGHTTTATELMVGFHVEGFAAAGEELLSIDRLRAGEALILTKALGTGVLFHAHMLGRARGAWVVAALASMLRPNDRAAAVARLGGARAATDVTGFGLVGHLGAMLRASRLSARLTLDALPALPGAVELLGLRLRSTFHAENERAKRGLVIAPEAAAHPKLELVFDPQTSGGLLFGVAQERAEAVLASLHAAGESAARRIGSTTPERADGARIELVAQ